jgi:HTH-type transcriptional regulator/antitoxin HigA
MNIRTPVQVQPPGHHLKQELEERGWSQVELAEILARPPRLISEILGGKRAITPETAKGLGAALGTSAGMWMKLEADYQLSKTRIETAVVSRRAKLYAKFPVKELLRRGWVRESTDHRTLEANFCEFFGIHSIDETPVFLHAAKKQDYDSTPGVLQLAWLNRAEEVASEIPVGDYSPETLESAVAELKSCLADVEDVSRVPSILLRAGVRLVVVEFLPGAKLDGACFWTDLGKSPVVALSLRMDRVDNFWHTLFHEIDHILHGEGKDEPIVDLFDKEATTVLPEFELRANRNAANRCIDQASLHEWIATTSRVSSRAKIMGFAERMGIHPGIVVGQLQHLGLVPYSFHRDMLEKVRSLVVASTPADGFGKA